MPVVKRSDFGTDRVAGWMRITEIAWMGASSRELGAQVEPHFHDGEEFWFVLEGQARLMIDGEEHVVQADDVACMYMGQEHSLEEVLSAPYRQVYIGCRLRGKRRLGHLHRGEDEPPSKAEMASSSGGIRPTP